MIRTTTQQVINSIRALGQLFPEDVAAITAALSCQIAKDLNAHLSLHQVAIDSLDDLHIYITNETEVTA